jgi:glycosyltransferase involved in cell wall biosynthesis
MRVLITTEQRLRQDSEGRVVTAGPLHYGFWERYLDVFQEVEILARVHARSRAHDGEPAVGGPGVRVRAVPAYIGPLGYLRSSRHLRRVAEEAVAQRGAVIVRAPSQLGIVLLSRLEDARRHAFGLEVGGDPLDVFSRGVIRHPLRGFFRWWFARHLRSQCREAAAIAYVSKGNMQVRYPPRPDSSQFVTTLSDVDLPQSLLVGAPRGPLDVKTPPRLVTVGSMEQSYKGVDVLIRAVRRCCVRGVPVSLVVVGEGRERQKLEALARDLLVLDRVEFAGQVPSPRDVVAYLGGMDLFVLASRTEGLPRAMIEAMARGLPCLGTRVGGIPELLDEEDLVPVSDPVALADKVMAVVADPERLATMSARNLARAQDYTTERLRLKRLAFHEAVRNATAQALGPGDSRARP